MAKSRQRELCCARAAPNSVFSLENKNRSSCLSHGYCCSEAIRFFGSVDPFLGIGCYDGPFIVVHEVFGKIYDTDAAININRFDLKLLTSFGVSL